MQIDNRPKERVRVLIVVRVREVDLAMMINANVVTVVSADGVNRRDDAIIRLCENGTLMEMKADRSEYRCRSGPYGRGGVDRGERAGRLYCNQDNRC